MAGDGAFPIQSSWFINEWPDERPKNIYAMISSIDSDTNDEALWNTWFFGAQPVAGDVIHNLPFIVTTGKLKNF